MDLGAGGGLRRRVMADSLGVVGWNPTLRRLFNHSGKRMAEDAPTFEFIVEELKHDIITTIFEWRIYSEWFRVDERRVELLNSASGHTTLVIQNALFERTIIAICKLTDPYRQGRFRNLSLYALMDFDASRNDSDLRCLINSAKEDSIPLREIRSKKLAHTDLERKTSKPNTYGISYQNIDDAVLKCGAVIQYVTRTYFDTHQELALITSYSEDEVAFLYALKCGIDEMSRRRSEPLPDDPSDASWLARSTPPEWLRERKFWQFGNSQPD